MKKIIIALCVCIGFSAMAQSDMESLMTEDVIFNLFEDDDGYTYKFTGNTHIQVMDVYDDDSSHYMMSVVGLTPVGVAEVSKDIIYLIDILYDRDFYLVKGDDNYGILMSDVVPLTVIVNLTAMDEYRIYYRFPNDLGR